MRNWRFASALLVAVCLLPLLAGRAGAEQTWTVRSGVTTIYFNPDLMRDLDLSLSDIVETAPFPPELEYRVEEPHWSFQIAPWSNLSFRVAHQASVPYGIEGGAIAHLGGMTLTDDRSGRGQSLQSLTMVYLPGLAVGPGGKHPTDELVLKDAVTGRSIFVLEHSMYDFRASRQLLWIHYMNMRFADGWPTSFGRPDLEGWTIGMAEILADAVLTGGEASPGDPYVPVLTDDLDVALGLLEGITQVGHDGVHPAGTVALSMATTSCNVGESDVPWLAPMEEDHPVIAMALYRQIEGRFEQIGVSWLKHGFYALSNDDCSECLHPSDGSFLGVGCSDTYGVNNNADRNYLGPRNEVNPFTAVWECEGSHFSGGQDDCVRRHGGSGHGPLDHRLNALDADLALPGATYLYEADYLVRDDIKRENNIGSRKCTMTWTGSVWDFETPTANNPLVEGPAIDRWGDLRERAAVDSTDGYYALAVRTTDLGDGRHHYEYAFFNRNSDLGARSFSIPVGSASVTNIGFHDSDYDPTNDWEVTLQDGVISWQTQDYETNPDANALRYGLMYNFRFDADLPPGDGSASVLLFKPHTPDAMAIATRVPGDVTAAPVSSLPSSLHLEPCQPNPLAPDTRIGFSLAVPGDASLEVFDSQGRRIRTLARGRLGSGPHVVTWDGSREDGRRAASGVYYVRLRAGGSEAVRSATLVR